MTIAELMAGYTPDADYEGFSTNDDMVLAVDCGTTAITEITAAAVAAMAVVGVGVDGISASLNPKTQDKKYLRTGTQTRKTDTQRGFKVTGDRYVGDAFQDFALSHSVKFGTGATVERAYAYFSLTTGVGESGTVTLLVNNDGSGKSGENAAIDIDLKKCGSDPAEYTYAAPTGG